ncbi:MBL fold metallo-hydrolase [Bacillus sp. SCS-151]|uniref:MBL fold metallo-hydrolase n=1 Tax=Nanhaiella sioensis TaxID=3115293 RepID=UPI00397C0671
MFSKRKVTIFACLLITSLFIFGCSKEDASTTEGPPSLQVIGHASVKIKTSDGKVIYIDPWAGDEEDYSEPADIILSTHGHYDHSDLSKVTKKDQTEIITQFYDFENKKIESDLPGKNIEVLGIHISAVAAYNDHHPIDLSYGYVLEFDGLRVYHAGDTGKIEEMNLLSDKNINYALLGMDGTYDNMNVEEAIDAAIMINADHVIPIHTDAPGIYNEENVEKFEVENKLEVKPGETIQLEEKN